MTDTPERPPRPDGIAATPEPPYWAVVFTSHLAGGDAGAYAATSARMVELARTMPGFLGVESARGPSGVGITVSYWESEEAIAGWGAHAEHLRAQARGREEWYPHWELRVCRVERARGTPR